MPINICKQCGNEFEASSKRPKYCRDRNCYTAKERADNRRRTQTYSPERRRAAVLVQAALFKGELEPQPCEVCGEARNYYIVAHHDDYAAPLDVRWLCRTDHKHHHNQFGPGRNA